MKALILIILALLGIILLLVLIGVMFAAIIAHDEAQWKKNKSKKYDQHNS